VSARRCTARASRAATRCLTPRTSLMHQVEQRSMKGT
jgi:hypothetical protein